MKTYHIYHSCKELPNNWDIVVKHDIFLQSAYLKVLENASPANIQLFYVGVFSANELVGVAVIQRVQLYLKDMFRLTKVSCFKDFFQNTISKIVKGNILVVGNLTHTGQHGVFFQSDKKSQTDYLNLLFSAIEDLKKQIKLKQNKKIRAIMFKDYFEDDVIHNERALFENHKFTKVSVQPNMVMGMKTHWISNNDYIKDFNKKYRDRYKTAKKKLATIKVEELSLEVIKNQSNKLHELYLNVSNHAKFNTFLLPENHFYALKETLKERFKIFGYYLEDQLIGFYTLILNNENLETYFLGYDNEHQYANKLYLNMLFDMAEFGIENSFKNVVYARTAMEIKSSVGAVPRPMFVYVKHTNSILNSVLKQLFGLMDPTQKWEARHPFKDVV